MFWTGRLQTAHYYWPSRPMRYSVLCTILGNYSTWSRDISYPITKRFVMQTPYGYKCIYLPWKISYSSERSKWTTLRSTFRRRLDNNIFQFAYNVQAQSLELWYWVPSVTILDSIFDFSRNFNKIHSCPEHLSTRSAVILATGRWCFIPANMIPLQLNMPNKISATSLAIMAPPHCTWME